MESKNFKYEIKSRVSTTDVEIVYKEKKLSIQIVEGFDGKANVSISGLVLNQNVTINFVSINTIFICDMIDEALTLFEKLYY